MPAHLNTILFCFTALENANKFFSISMNLASNSVVCTFHKYSQNSINKKSCSIEYWLKEDKTCFYSSTSFIQTSYSTVDVMTIGLPSSSLSGGQYCFTVTGDNGTYTAVLEGVFDTNQIIVITQGKLLQKQKFNATNEVIKN